MTENVSDASLQFARRRLGTHRKRAAEYLSTEMIRVVEKLSEVVIEQGQTVTAAERPLLEVVALIVLQRKAYPRMYQDLQSTPLEVIQKILAIDFDELTKDKP
ncbi:MAG: hypothetical protein Q7W55_09675 [Pseudohongiella sp.]|nr:hypothetical protein [Pseudohongiella sp.]